MSAENLMQKSYSNFGLEEAVVLEVVVEVLMGLAQLEQQEEHWALVPVAEALELKSSCTVILVSCWFSHQEPVYVLRFKKSPQRLLRRC